MGVRTNDPSALDELAGLLPPGASIHPAREVEHLMSVLFGGEARGGVRRFNLLYCDAGRFARTRDRQELLDSFESVVQLQVAAAAKRRVFVHAGVVGWRGRAILVPGRSFTGKTTLVGELVRAGAAYYSDEYAVLDEHGRVHPYPKPPSVRTDSTGRQYKVPLEEFGARGAAKGALPVGMVVLGEYRRGASWRPRELSAGRGALELLGHAVAARLRPERVLAAVSRVASEARVLKGVRGEAEATARRILAEASE